MKANVSADIRKEIKAIRAKLAYILGVKSSEVKLHVAGDCIVAADVRGEVFYMDLFNL